MTTLLGHVPRTKTATQIIAELDSLYAPTFYYERVRTFLREYHLGAKIVDGDIDFLIFFWDPLESLSHDPDVKALLRMAVVWNIPIACNRATAEFMISSPLMDEEYDRLLPKYDEYRNRTAMQIVSD